MVSAATLGNVGNCALSTGLLLTAGSREITAAALRELAGVAERELATQSALSATAIRGGSTAAAERVVLETWRDYYVSALEKIPDLAVVGGSWTAEIATAQDRVRKAAAQALAALGDR